MARNRYAGKHPSYKARGMSPKQIKAKRAYDKKYHQQPKAKKYRAELNAANKKAGTYGKSGGKDRVHTSSGKVAGLGNRSKNRGNNRPRVRQTRAPRK